MRFIQLVTFIVGITLILTAFSNKAIAQTSGEVAPVGQEFSFHMGPLLPDQVYETAEILKAVGVRYGYPFSAKSLTEFGYTGAHTAGAKYTNFDLSLRGDVPILDLFAFGLIGADITRIHGPATPSKIYPGGHIAGGVLAHVADTLFLRTELRFTFNPGTILFFGFGFEYRFGAGGGK
jgi:hypothetical protein